MLSDSPQQGAFQSRPQMQPQYKLAGNLIRSLTSKRRGLVSRNSISRRHFDVNSADVSSHGEEHHYNNKRWPRRRRRRRKGNNRNGRGPEAGSRCRTDSNRCEDEVKERPPGDEDQVLIMRNIDMVKSLRHPSGKSGQAKRSRKRQLKKYRRRRRKQRRNGSRKRRRSERERQRKQRKRRLRAIRRKERKRMREEQAAAAAAASSDATVALDSQIKATKHHVEVRSVTNHEMNSESLALRSRKLWLSPRKHQQVCTPHKHLIDSCTWPHCNISCPNLKNPSTGS